MSKEKFRFIPKTQIRNQTTKNKKNNQKIKKIALILISALFILSFVVYFIYFITFKPNKTQLQNRNNQLLIKRDDLRSTLFVFEASNNLQITGAWYVIYNQKNAFSMVYYIPTGVYMKDYLGSVSSYISVGELKYVGNRIDQNRAEEYTIWQLSNLTGVVPDSYVWMNMDELTLFANMFGDVSDYKKSNYSENFVDGDKLSTELYQIYSLVDKFNSLKLFLNYRNNKQFINSLDTNMSFGTFRSVMKNTKAAFNTGNVFVLDLSQVWATVPLQQASGKEVNVVNYQTIDEKLSEVVTNLKGRELEREQVKVEIYNASDIEGLAQRYSRKFENSGVDVVRFENAPSSEDKTKLYVPQPEKYDHSLDTVKKLLGVDVEIIYTRPEFMTTGDIVVVLGEDIAYNTTWR